jgi:hypothetical protein
MQAKGLTVLIAATAVVVVAAVAVSVGGGRGVGDARNGEKVLPAVADHLGDVAALKISGAGGKATLLRKGTAEKPQWVVAEKGDYPADALKIRQVLLGFSELKLIEPKTSKPDFYTRLDVEDPGKDRGKDLNHSRLVEIDDAKGGKLGELIVGKRRPDSLGSGADGLYIRRLGEAQAWLAQGSVDLPADLKDWLDKKIVSIPAARVQTVTLTHPDGSKLVLKRDKEGDKFAVQDAPADAKLKSDTIVSEPAGALDALELSDVKPAADEAAPGEGVSQAEWTTFDGLTVTAETFEKDGSSWVHLKATGTEKAADEAKTLDEKLSPWTFAVYQYKTNAMKTKLADIVEPPKAS